MRTAANHTRAMETTYSGSVLASRPSLARAGFAAAAPTLGREPEPAARLARRARGRLPGGLDISLPPFLGVLLGLRLLRRAAARARARARARRRDGPHAAESASLPARGRGRGRTERASQGGAPSAAEAEAAAAPPRRRVVAASAALLAAALVAPAPESAWAERLGLGAPALARARGKVVVVTGATAGVGLEASRTMVAEGADVYVTGRTLAKATAAAAELTASTKGVAGVGRAIPMELNLASLDSVRRFAAAWEKDVKRPIDILACNAGLALGQDLKEPQLTEDGFELTVGTNHLGHFLLVNLLQKGLSPDARVVVTASSVHDPATGDPGSQASLGKLVGLGPGFGKDAPMVDGGAFDAGKAYKDSKLCNVLFTLELARRLKSQGSRVTANCMSPGLMPTPTFFRNQNPTFAGVFAFAATNLLKIAETPVFGGDTLSFMALDPSLDGRSGLFYSAIPPGRHVFVEKTPSSDVGLRLRPCLELDASVQVFCMASPPGSPSRGLDLPHASCHFMIGTPANSDGGAFGDFFTHGSDGDAAEEAAGLEGREGGGGGAEAAALALRSGEVPTEETCAVESFSCLASSRSSSRSSGRSTRATDDSPGQRMKGRALRDIVAANEKLLQDLPSQPSGDEDSDSDGEASFSDLELELDLPDCISHI